MRPRQGFAAHARVGPWSAWAFWLAALGFAGLALWLGVADRWAGGFDSLQNLAVARNIAEGRGFTSWVVTQHTIPVTLPGPELVRPPGAPYLAALAFALGGARPGVALLLSALLVLLTALALRAAVRLAGGGWLGDVCGVLLLLSHGDYELVSFWNNGLLTALTAGGILLAVAVARGRIQGVPLAVACALLGGAGFLAKPTFLLGALPFAVVLLTRGPGARREPQLGRVVLCLALFAAVSAPYWLRNWLLLGQPLVLAAPRLAVRYELPSRWQAVALAASHPLSYRDVASRIGWNGIVASELRLAGETLLGLLRLGPLAVAGALLALPFLRARDRWLAGAAGALTLSPLSDCVYLHPEDRYLWPVLPVLLLVMVLGLLGAKARAEGSGRGAGLARVTRVVLPALLVASLALAVPRAISGFGDDFDEATTDPPDWQPAVAGLPADARVLTWDAPAVAWYARRQAVIAPLGEPEAVARALAYYRPTHVLVEEDWFPSAVAAATRSFKDRLVPLARGDDWALYRISRGPRLAQRFNP